MAPAIILSRLVMSLISMFGWLSWLFFPVFTTSQRYLPLHFIELVVPHHVLSPIWSETIMIIRMALTKFWSIRCVSLLYVLKWLHTFLPHCYHLESRTCFTDIWPTMWKGIIWYHHLTKYPVSAEMVNGILVRFWCNSKDLRIAAWSGCAIDFAGFFRCNKICPTRLQFLSDYLSIFNPLSNTDVYREGNGFG